jgi:Ca2+-binding EF-hand superfamily protein
MKPSKSLLAAAVVAMLASGQSFAFTLPAGFKIPSGFTLPAGFTIPSGFTMPAGFTIPSSNADLAAMRSGMFGSMIGAFDKDGDGKISKAEADAFPEFAKRFADIDTNKDGFITSAELEARMNADFGSSFSFEGGSLDKDGDGKISRAEAATIPALAERFDSIDANKDGFITPAEMREQLGSISGSMFDMGIESIDTNGDGKISRAEAAVYPEFLPFFDALDTNKDGFLTVAEMTDLANNPGGMFEVMVKALDKNGDGKISKAEADASGKFGSFFDAMDKNKDGFLTSDEMQSLTMSPDAALDAFFNRFDTNKDGKISKAEADAGSNGMMGRFFDTLDKNKDGFVTRDEMKSFGK